MGKRSQVALGIRKCGLCGEHPEVLLYRHKTGVGRVTEISCPECKVQSTVKSSTFMALEAVTELWNKTHGEGIEREYTIWMEGYATNGERSDAQKIGSAKGRSFREAVLNFAAKKDKVFQECFDSSTLSYWGCNLYPTERQARESFG